MRRWAIIVGHSGHRVVVAERDSQEEAEACAEEIRAEDHRNGVAFTPVSVAPASSDERSADGLQSPQKGQNA